MIVCAGRLVEIEGVQRMAEGHHHVVRDVDDVVDRAQPDRLEPLLDAVAAKA